MIMCARCVGLGRICSNNAKLGSLQNPYHTSRFAPYVLFCVHRVANLRRSIRVYHGGEPCLLPRGENRTNVEISCGIDISFTVNHTYGIFFW